MASQPSDALAFFQSELANDDQHIRVQACERLRYIAYGLHEDEAKRAERVEKELVPYLMDLVNNKTHHGNGEIRHKIGMNIPLIATMMNKGALSILLPIVFQIAREEEQVVRDQAFLSFKKIAELNPSLVPDMFTMFKKLSISEWFTPKLVAIQWMPDLYPRLGDAEQKESINILQALSSDEAPMVRRAVANSLQALLGVIQKDHLLNAVGGGEHALIHTYNVLATDNSQDTIRRACVDAAVVMATTMSPEENKLHTLPILTGAAEDRSWRVRLRLAKIFSTACQKMPNDQVSSYLLPSFVSLLRDTEQEVRIAATKAITESVGHLPAEQLQSFLAPHLQGLAMDTCQGVRAALGKAIGALAVTFGRDLTQKLLLSIILDLFKDEYHEARLNIVMHAGQICEVLGMDAVVSSSNLLNALQLLIMDNQWRIRLAVVEQTALLAKQFGVDMFQQKLEAVFLSCVDDSVFYVRQKAVDVVHKVARHFGPAWTVDHLLPKILEHYSANAGFVMRVTVLNMTHKLADGLSTEQVMEHLLPLVLRGANDAVTNVRCQALHILNDWIQNPDIGIEPEKVARQLRQELPRLQQDTDADVQLQVYCTMKLIEAV